MRIRTRHIVVIVVVLITAFILYATSMQQIEEETLDPFSGLTPPADMPMEDAPEISLDSTHIDLGVIANDKETRTEVPVYNRGGSVLEISDVRTSCSMCTVGYFEPGEHRINPGDSSQMQITVSPKGIHGFHSRKTLTLLCNDPRNPRMEVVVEAHVDPEYVLEPESFDFGDVQKGEPAQTSLLLRNCGETTVAVLAVTLEPDETTPRATDNITFEIMTVAAGADATGQAYRITATLAPEMRSGPFEIPVFIHTDLKRFAIYRILATGTLIAPYTVEIDQPNNTLHLKNDTTETVTIHSDTAFHLEGIRSEHGYFVPTEQQDDDTLCRIRCKPSEALERGMHKDLLLFTVKQNATTYTERIETIVYSFGVKSRDKE